MPWSKNRSAVGWWPADIDPKQKELLSKIPDCYSHWPNLYVSGSVEDDEVVKYLQSIGQPFQLYSHLETSADERQSLGLESDRPAFWYPGFTTKALVGLDRIRRQFEYEARRHQRITWPRVMVAA